MNSTALSFQREYVSPAWWQRLVKTNRFLAFNLLAYAALLAVTVVAALVDPRLVTGQPVWLKPLKFALSILLYSGTLLWMLSYVQGKRRLVRLIAGATAVAFWVELAIICLQAFRGVRSHFNVGTPWDERLFQMMGMFIMVVALMNLLAARLLLFQRLPDRAFAWSLRLALIITLIGAGLGYLMIPPTPSQEAALATGTAPTFIGAHSVGVADGGPGLPLTGWSTEGGDLRIPHFVGLHALQFLPLLALLLRRRWGAQLTMARQSALIWVGALGYLGLTLLLTWQALRGQSVIAPDAATLLALALLIATVGLSGWAVVATAKAHSSEI